MSQQEMADKLQVNKSTVSRRMAALRESGELDTKATEAAKRESQQARERLQSCTMSRTDRLEALAELKDMLHAELALAGGQGLARVSSEYRAVLEQIEALSIELDLTTNAAKRLNPVQLMKMKHQIFNKYAFDQRDTVNDVIDSVLKHLANLGIVDYTPLDAILSSADMN